MSSWLRFWVGVALAVAVVLLFSRALTYPFLNWDDPSVFVRNAALHADGFIGWAFTTMYMEHYQPLAWLAWGIVDRMWSLTPAAAHALNIGLHALCAALVFALAKHFAGKTTVAVAAALLFAVHPLRVEVVAWASAMPYSLALLFALLSVLVFLDARERGWMIGLSIALFALSLLARPIAVGLPPAFYALVRAQRLGLRAERGHTRDQPQAGALSPQPSALAWFAFVALALGAAVVESQARAGGAMLNVGLGARLTLALTAPFRYLWRTVAPINLTPLDALALAPRADLFLSLLCGAALIVVSWAAWRWRRAYPGALLAWISYLALLAPAAGLLPSGLQATADRYSYLPSVPLSIWVAGAFAVALAHATGRAARLKPSRYLSVSIAVATVVIAALAWVSHHQMQFWESSVALWTRAVALDPASDVALYNLASALAEEGRRDEASARYEEVLRLVPDHADARKNRDLLQAATAEDQGNRLAQAGGLDAAIEQYRHAIALDPARTHSQAALGMALVQSGRASDAVPYLREAIKLGAPEPAVPNALAFALVNAGRSREACDVLEAASAKFPGDANIAGNLQRLTCETR